MLLGAEPDPSRGPGQALATPAPPRGHQEEWPRGSRATSQGGAGQPLERRLLQSRGWCAWGHQSQGAQGLRGTEEAARREKTPGARRRRRGKAGRWWRGRAPQRKGTRSKTGSPRYWALNLPRKKRERVTQALWSCKSSSMLGTEEEGARACPTPRHAVQRVKKGGLHDQLTHNLGSCGPALEFRGRENHGVPGGTSAGDDLPWAQERRGGSCNLFGGHLAKDSRCR